MIEDASKASKVLIVGPIPGQGNYIGGVGTLISAMLQNWHIPFPVAFYNTNTGRREYGSTGRVNLQNLGRFLRNAAGVVRAVRREQPVLVHFHTSRHWALLKDVALAALVRLTNKCKLVAHIHSASYGALLVGRLRCGRRLQLKLLRTLFDGIILMSESIKSEILSELEAADPRRFEAAARVVYNFVELPRLDQGRSMGAGVVAFLFLGNVGPQKGIFDLIAAAALLTRRHPNKVRFIIAGPFDSPPIGIKLRRQIEQAELSRCVELTGQVAGERKEALLRQADVFVLPSYAEGLPISMLEAMSYGLPVVATRVGGIPEVLRDGEAGILIEPGHVAGLYVALDKLCSSGEMRERMGRCGRACVERAHTPERFLSQLEAFYTELLARPRKGEVRAFSDCISGPTGRRNLAQG